MGEGREGKKGKGKDTPSYFIFNIFYFMNVIEEKEIKKGKKQRKMGGKRAQESVSFSLEGGGLERKKGWKGGGKGGKTETNDSFLPI